MIMKMVKINDNKKTIMKKRKNYNMKKKVER